jgi:hypothetical protein
LAQSRQALLRGGPTRREELLDGFLHLRSALAHESHVLGLPRLVGERFG